MPKIPPDVTCVVDTGSAKGEASVTSAAATRLGYPQFFSQLADVLAVPHALYGHPLKLPGVSLPFHSAAPFPAKCAHPNCLNTRVHSILAVVYVSRNGA